jgi:hypothetical protein
VIPASARTASKPVGYLPFYDEAGGRTRLEIRQWLPEYLARPSEEGWLQAFTKLDATLMSVQAVAADHRG